MLALTVRVAGADPLEGETVSHDCDFEAVKESVPPPVLVIWSDCEAGLEPPASAENERLNGETDRTGEVEIVKVTLTA